MHKNQFKPKNFEFYHVIFVYAKLFIPNPPPFPKNWHLPKFIAKIFTDNVVIMETFHTTPCTQNSIWQRLKVCYLYLYNIKKLWELSPVLEQNYCMSIYISMKTKAWLILYQMYEIYVHYIIDWIVNDIKTHVLIYYEKISFTYSIYI